MKMKILLIVFLILACSGCGNQNQPKEQAYHQEKHETLYSLAQIAKDNNLHSMFDSGSNSFLVGETDPIYRLKANEATVFSGDSSFSLPEAPKGSNGDLLLTKASVDTLFSPPEPTTNTIQSLAWNNVNPNDLISYAKRFMGTPYHFNAGPYPSTHVFDCSSFVRYVYGHFGISLPRTSLEQAAMGRRIDRANLNPGDLLFFFTPGRYNSNRIVGHVGMYIGNNEMINTWGAPGVTITHLNSYWDGRFLFAKRVIG